MVASVSPTPIVSSLSLLEIVGTGYDDAGIARTISSRRVFSEALKVRLKVEGEFLIVRVVVCLLLLCEIEPTVTSSVDAETDKEVLLEYQESSRDVLPPAGIFYTVNGLLDLNNSSGSLAPPEYIVPV